jgi:signal transduction histidine kinase
MSLLAPGLPEFLLRRGRRVADLLLLVIMSLLGPINAGAQTPEPLAPWQVHQLAVLTDPGGVETIESISQPGRAAEFKPAPNGFSVGYTRRVHWLRFTLAAPSGVPPAQHLQERAGLLEIQPPALDDLRLYSPSASQPGTFDLWQAGDLQPYAQREIKYRGFAHRIVFSDAQPLTVYLRVQTSGSSVVVLRWWEPTDFFAVTAKEYAAIGVLFGLLLAGLVFSLRRSVLRKDALRRRFLAYQLATLFLLIGINGLPAEMLFTQTPWIGDLWTSLGLFVFTFFSVRFHGLALQLATAPRWMRLLNQTTGGMAVIALPLSALGLFAEAMNVFMSFVLLTLMVGCLRSLQLWHQQVPQARLLYLAHLLPLGGGLATVLVLLGVLPGQLWLMYSIQFGTLGSLLVLQLLVAQRERLQDAERQQSRLDADFAQTMADRDRLAHEHQRHFLAMLTHELKTPLSVIRLRLGVNHPSDRMQRHAHSAVNEITVLIDECALVSKIEDNQLQRQAQPCNIYELLSELRAQCRQPERVELSLPNTAPEHTLYTDRQWLRTVLSNLLDNALKYSPPHAEVTITLDANDRAGHAGLHFAVSNPIGAAGAPDALQLYKKYYRAPGARAQSGSGLGLYIVKQLVELLGGHMTYQPTDSHITFELWLPL